MEQAIILLKTAMALLAMLSGIVSPELEPIKQQAFSIAEQAIILANNEIAKIQISLNTPITSIEPTLEPEPLPIIETSSMPKLKPKIEVISPMSNKGLGRKYIANSKIVNESNYVELGLIVWDDDGKVRDDLQVIITATDESQNKTLNGTGNVTPIYDKHKTKVITPYYHYHYKFKTAGKHTITFAVNGMEENVTLKVDDPVKNK